MELTDDNPVISYTYVDNVGVMGTKQSLVQSFREDAAAELDNDGLETHEATEAVLVDEALGS